MNARPRYNPEELQTVCQLLLEMRDNCRKSGGSYDDPKRIAKAEALDIALGAVGNLPDWVPAKVEVKLDDIMEGISKQYDAELQVYPTNDGRMKYELYVKLPEE